MSISPIPEKISIISKYFFFFFFFFYSLNFSGKDVFFIKMNNWIVLQMFPLVENLMPQLCNFFSY